MTQVEYIRLDQIRPNPYQPRLDFSEEGIVELADSIRENGLIQPIVVRPVEDGQYEIVVGERRYRACQILNHEAIPAIVAETSNDESARMALIENLQREDLSSIEEAKAYKQLLDLTGSTQEQLAEKLGKSQSSVANKLRLLNLSQYAQEAIVAKTISERHGRAMLSLTPRQQKKLVKLIREKDLTVKEAEKYIKTHFTEKAPKETDDDDFNIRCFGVSTQIAINTIRDAVKSLENVNVALKLKEEQTDDNYIMTITLKK